jgi:hypothetical protein
MKLFEFRNFEPIATEEVVLIPAFAALIKKFPDTYIDYFTYIFFMYDYRSDFNDIVDIGMRHKMVMENVLPGKSIENSVALGKAIEVYDLMQISPSMRLVISARIAMSKIETFLNDVDLTLLDGNDKPIYNVKQIADVVGNLSKMTTALNDLESTVKREMDEGSRIRGGGNKGFFEDPNK